MPANSVIQLRRGTAAQWTSANPVLAAGEPGYETDTGKEKRGDGATAWVSLPYFTPGNGTFRARKEDVRLIEDYSVGTLVSGTTDCTDAINAALADSGSAAVPIRALSKKYMTQGGHLLPSYTHIEGSGGFPDKNLGTIFQLLPNAGQTVMRSASWGQPNALDYKITLRDFAINGGIGISQPTLAVTHPQAYVMADVAVSATPFTATVDSTANFPASGYIWLGRQLCAYTGTTSTTFTGCTQVAGQTAETIKANAWVVPLNGNGHGIALQAALCNVSGLTIAAVIASCFAMQGTPGLIAYENLNVGLKAYTAGRFGIEIGEGATDNNWLMPTIGDHLGRGCILIRGSNNKIVRPHIMGEWSTQDSALIVSADHVDVSGPFFDRCASGMIRLDTTIRGGIPIEDPSVTFIDSGGCNLTGVIHNNAISARTNNARVTRGELSGLVQGGGLLTRYQNAYNYAPWAALVGAQNPTTISTGNGGSGKLQVDTAAEFFPRPTASQTVVISSDTVSYTGKTRALTSIRTAVSSGATTIRTWSADTTFRDRMSDPFAASGTLLIGGNGVMTPFQVTYTNWDGEYFTGCSGIVVDLPAGLQITQDFLTGVTGASSGTLRADATSVFGQGQIALVRTRLDSLRWANMWAGFPIRVGGDLYTGLDHTPALQWQVGAFYSPQSVLVSTGLTVNQRLSLAPIYVPNTSTIGEVAAEVTGAGNAGATIRFAIYDNLGSWPNGLVYGSGDVAADTTGIKNVTGLSVVVDPGWYWVGVLVLNAAGTAPTMRTLGMSDVSGAIPTTDATTALQTSTAGAQRNAQTSLPAPFGAAVGTVNGGVVPRVALKTA